jgi:hypothetical protein
MQRQYAKSVHALRRSDLRDVSISRLTQVYADKTYRATMTVVIVLVIHGGVHSRRLIVGEYPIVAANVGKNMPYDIDAMAQPNAVPTHHALQSVINDNRSEELPDDLGPAGAWLLESSSIRF